VTALAAQNIQLALIAASRSEAGRARAISALRGTEVYAATWNTDATQLRTLLNSAGMRALALFSDERQLGEAALRFGWLGVDGSVSSRRLHISEAIRFARGQRVGLVIIDITSDHALELDDGELELVAAPPSGRPPSNTGLTSVSSLPPRDNGSELKRVSTRPPPANDQAGALSANGLRPSSVSVDEAHHAVSASFGAARTATMAALKSAPDEELVNAFCHVLREYPEVEWACLAAEAERPDALSVVLRIEPAFRKHMAEISSKLRQAANAYGTSCDVLVLDTPEQMKRARAIGLPFYPWRKR
jgi:hypothetical protein